MPGTEGRGSLPLSLCPTEAPERRGGGSSLPEAISHKVAAAHPSPAQHPPAAAFRPHPSPFPTFPMKGILSTLSSVFGRQE